MIASLALRPRTKKRCSPVLRKHTQGALGVRTDSETGLVYMRARHYDPGIQRFISRDPIGLAGGANSYSYGGNNPARFVDPSGLDTLDLAFPAILAGAVAAGAELAAIGTGVAVGLPAAVALGVGVASVRDGMAPLPIAPGAGRGPFFGDTMGSDRWGGRIYEVLSDSMEVPEWKIPPKVKPGIWNKNVPKPVKEGRGLTLRGNHDTPKGGQCIEKYRKCLENVRFTVRIGNLDRGFQGVHERLCFATFNTCFKGCNYTPQTWFWPWYIM